jgi:AhpD family alkylhydroperoxidase
MSIRTSIAKSSREGYRRVVDLDAYVTDNIDFELVNLVYLRVSFVNGCNYCVDAHSTDLINAEVPVRKVTAVTTWNESTLFTNRERLALELADAVTHISGGVSDELWERGTAEFGEKGLGDLILAIGTVNLWNRIAIPTHLPVPPLG